MAKKKSSKGSAPKEVPYKPTLTIEARKYKKDLKVGKTARVVVKGKVVEESLRDYEGVGKTYRLEIDSVKPATKRKK